MWCSWCVGRARSLEAAGFGCLKAILRVDRDGAEVCGRVGTWLLYLGFRMAPVPCSTLGIMGLGHWRLGALLAPQKDPRGSQQGSVHKAFGPK